MRITKPAAEAARVVRPTLPALVAAISVVMFSALPAAAEEPLPEIVRGPGSVAAASATVEPVAGERIIAAGDRLWLVDEDGRRLTACRLVNTSQVGVRRIECATRRWPLN